VAFLRHATEKTENGLIGESESICKYPSFCRCVTKRRHRILGAALMASCSSESEDVCNWLREEEIAWLDFFCVRYFGIVE
jgi:hypothetical protein